MPSPLVRTKLYIPQVRRGLVPRPRLGERLDRTPPPRLTLVSAPPGFGKTTLLAAWLDAATAADRPVAWVSLEESEQEPASFWTYVVTALDAAAPGVGAGALPLLPGRATRRSRPSSPPCSTSSAPCPGGLDLVLDDYHLADGPAIADDMAFLLEHLPPQVHLVISTRADPALPLARLRARGELVEVRAADLRFTLDEVAAYLNEVVGLDLAPRDIAALEGRTEGWIAALQLAALSLQGRDDAAGFIAGFAGDDRYVVDYLVEEVLARQPDAVRRFLLADLDPRPAQRLRSATPSPAGTTARPCSSCSTAPTCSSSRSTTAATGTATTTCSPTSCARTCSRSGPTSVADLHRRAGQWYDAAGEPVAAVRHALAAGDVERRGRPGRAGHPGLLRDRQEATVRRLARRHPATRWCASGRCWPSASSAR